MKNINISVFLIFIVCSKISLCQSIDETKDFIIQTIENNALIHYKTSAEFTENSTILNYHNSNLKDDGTVRFVYNYAFDVAGIKYIIDGTEYTTGGNLVHKITIYLNIGYSASSELGTTGFAKYSDNISIYLDSQDPLTKIKKALLHLCKLSGGLPSEEDLFED